MTQISDATVRTAIVMIGMYLCLCKCLEAAQCREITLKCESLELTAKPV